jgi:hypothetical protein
LASSAPAIATSTCIVAQPIVCACIN